MRRERGAARLRTMPAPAAVASAAPRRGYFDPAYGRYMIKVAPGDCRLTERHDEVLTTVLGSCVSACMRDPATGLGGMNHFMLPESESGEWGGVSSVMRFGNHAMESLINRMMAIGCPRERLEIKVFGGGNVIKNSQQRIGDLNARFVRSYLANEGLHATSVDLGGDMGRRILFFPDTGTVKRLFLDPSAVESVSTVELRLRTALSAKPASDDIELFE